VIQSCTYPVKRKRAPLESDPPGIAGWACDGMSNGRRGTTSPSHPSLSDEIFLSIPHASKKLIKTVAYFRTSVVGFTLNQDIWILMSPHRKPPIIFLPKILFSA